MSRSPSGARCLAVWFATSVVAGAAGVLAAAPLLSWSPGVTGPRFEELIVALAAVSAIASLAWLWLTSSVLLLGAAVGRIWSLPGCPAPLRRVLLVACGVALANGFAAAHADTGRDDPGRVDQAVHGPGLSGLFSELPLPDRAESFRGPRREPGPRPESRTTEPRTSQPRTSQPSAAGRGPVTVRAGDTLWGIVARQLPGGASDARIAAAVDSWHRRNRAVIGPDPDLILPGQRLAPPNT